MLESQVFACREICIPHIFQSGKEGQKEELEDSLFETLSVQVWLKLRTSRWESVLDCLDRPGLVTGILNWRAFPGCNQRDPKTGGWSERGDDAISEDGGRGPQAKEYVQRLEAGKAKDIALSRRLQKGISPSDAWIWAQWDLYQTSDLQNCELIHLGCFKPLSLQQFVKAA